MTWIFKQTEETLWTVGFYDPDGKWRPDSDHGSSDEAGDRVHRLNGGCGNGCVTPVMREHGDKVRSLSADFDAAMADYRDGEGDSDTALDVAVKLSDVAGDLARLLNPDS